MKNVRKHLYTDHMFQVKQNLQMSNNYWTK